MQISELPSEMIIEIIKFSSNRLNLLLKLCLLSIFIERRSKILESLEFYSLPKDFEISIVKTNANEKFSQRLLRIKRLEIEDRRNIITEPIFYNTGVYYFEIKCLQWHNDGGDNVFVGFIFQPSKTINNYNTINFKAFLGSNSNKTSFGLYFPNGDIYGLPVKNHGYTENMKYFNQRIKVNTKVGVYLDTDNLLVRFVLVKEKKCFPMLSLDKFLNEEELASFKKKELVFYPAISLLYNVGELELNSTAAFRSIKKAQWIKDVVSQQLLEEVSFENKEYVEEVKM